ncbi:Histone deacetylase 15 [Zostera marina]|uniref:histone deacetylase n=1 Tax=Zostera marina TaxID=29655 RepID=A0A0K9PDN9_ZOSMR|nr:Histone deacetylase 15 [Zostera marina]
MSMIDEDSHSEEEKEYSPQKRQSKDCDGLAGSDTLMELAEMEENYDDEEYVDSDWEPSTENSNENEEDSDGSSALWFCTNCTMKNSDDLSHCKSCKEYKNSGILKHGCFASQFQQGFANSSDLDVTMECTEHRNYSTVIGFDDRMLLHYEIGKSHPHVERPDRILAISASLSFAGIFPGKCFLIPPREISEEELNLVHAKDNIEAVKSTKHFLHSYFTPDTYTNKYSACAARLAAGFCSDLAISIMTGKARNGFSLVRPPGHHAGIKKAMGFCLHNNAAIAAIAAQSVGAKKILIVDWDVHHGNGTQEIFEENKSVLYISLHRHDDGIFYPGTGAADEVGILEGKGYSVNVPWKTGGVGDNDYIFAFQNIILPIASKFAPDFTIVSAGFDAARGDPLGCCDVTPAGYAQMTHMLCDLSQGKMLVILEGGYNLRSISSSAVAVVKVLLGEIPRKKPSDDINPTFKGYQTVMEVLKIQSRFWPFLTAKYDQIQLKWASAIYQKKSEKLVKKKLHTCRRRSLIPLWWKWRSIGIIYRRAKVKSRSKKVHISFF